MELNIGEEIKKVAKNQRIGPTELAKMLSMTPPNVHKIWAKKTIDTELLLKISKVLDFDFFALYTERYKFKKGLDSAMLGPNATVEATELEKCKLERDSLREKCSDLNRLVKAQEKTIGLQEIALDNQRERIELLEQKYEKKMK